MFREDKHTYVPILGIGLDKLAVEDQKVGDQKGLLLVVVIVADSFENERILPKLEGLHRNSLGLERCVRLAVGVIIEIGDWVRSLEQGWIKGVGNLLVLQILPPGERQKFV